MRPDQAQQHAASRPLAGVMLLGGAHGSLAMARGFGRLGIPVALVSNDHPLPKWSRYLHSQFNWPGAGAENAAESLVKLAERHGYCDWLLLPCGDSEVKLVASERDMLQNSFQILSCGWERLNTLCDKQMLAASALAAGIAIPNNYRVMCESDARTIDVVFPVVLKPAMRMEENAFTRAKAWRADSRDELIARYRDAVALVGGDNVVVQELIPGSGETQFSYAALWHQGAPVAEMTARRTRQYPFDFSYTSTFVEVSPNDTLLVTSRKLLGATGFEGLVEIEYKFDARDRRYKILDVNPRPWSWIALCEAAGLDFALLIRQLAAGDPMPRREVRTDR